MRIEDQYEQVIIMIANDYTQAEISKHFNISLANSTTLCAHDIEYHKDKIRNENRTTFGKIRDAEATLYEMAIRYSEMKDKNSIQAIRMSDNIKELSFKLEKLIINK